MARIASSASVVRHVDSACAIFRVLTFIGLILAASLLINAQAPPNPDAGIQMWSSNEFGINLATSAINIQIPLRSKIGAIPFWSRLFGTSNAYEADYAQGGSEAFYTNTGIGPYSDPTSVSVNATSTSGTCPGQPTETYTEFTSISVTDASGASHPLGNGVNNVWKISSYCPQTPGPLLAGDGSGYTFVITSSTGTSGTFSIYDPSGHHWNGSCTSVCYMSQTITDTDGNQITDSYYGGPPTTDTLGTTALSVTYPIGSGNPSSYSYTNENLNPTTQSYTFNYDTTDSFKTNFGCPYVVDSGGMFGYFLKSLGTPDGGEYTFAYEPTPNGNGFTNTNPPTYFTGRIAKITFPAGGSISYSYSGGNNGYGCTTGVVPTLTVTTNDNNGNIGTWTYVNNGSGAGGNFTVIKTDPAGNQTTYYFNGGYQTEVVYYQGTSTVLKTVLTCYNGNTSNCAAPSSNVSLPISETDVRTTLGTSHANRMITTFDSYGNPLVVSVYDFGGTITAPSGVLLSTTTKAYGQSYNNATSCNSYASGTYINNTPCNIVTTNSAGTAVAQTKITYSSTGHPTQIEKWTNDSTWLTISATYNTNGTVATATDVNGAVTDYYYDGTGGCSDLLLTSLTVDALTASAQWDCNGGVVTKTIDPNQQPTGYTYNDPLWRVKSMTDPAGNVTSYSYPSQTTFESAMNFNGGTSTSDTLITTDGLGRRILVQRRQAQGATNFDSVQTGYTWNSGTLCTGAGLCTTVSMPYAAASGGKAPGGTPVTTTQLDALGRPLQITDGGGGTVTYTYVLKDVFQSVGPTPNFSKQFEYDGMGRLTSVCELISAAGSGYGPCNQANAENGFLTTYTYDPLGNLLTVAQNTQSGAIGGSQLRTYSYDGLSRLTSETNPESGTTSYIYDSYPSPGTCGGWTNQPGDLMQINRANGISSCYIHNDPLHRLTRTCGGVGTCQAFRYDNSAGVTGTRPAAITAVNNSLGRMVEAETDNATAWPPTPESMITDEWFSYSSRGEETDEYESTSVSSGAYSHSLASYWANGQLETLHLLNTEGNALIPLMTYGVDGEGRRTTVSSNGAYNPVTAATYTLSGTAEPIGSLTSITLGAGGSDTYEYYTTTGRMKQYSLNVNGQSLSGNLTWNQNGTLAQLGITDPFNSGDNQTCTYSYDALARITGANCGNVWAQTFGYDAFGNINKSGSIAWACATCYTANNQYNSSVGTVSYDASGNLLNDTFNIYTWGDYNELASVNGNAVIEDAFGRMVQNGGQNGGGATQFAYSPAGGPILASMNGPSLNVAIVPLTGNGEFAVYGGSGLIQYNHGDWLGSGRLYSTPAQSTSGIAYAPFGEGYAATNSNTYVQFTATGNVWTQNDDNNDEGTLDDFTYRRYNPTQGRWISPDPAGLAAANPANPQSWNRYAYVMNNPLNATDPLGLQSSNCFINPRTGTCFQGYTNGADPTAGQCQASIDGGGDAPCSLVFPTADQSTMFATSLCGGGCGVQYSWQWQQSWQWSVGSTDTYTYDPATGQPIATSYGQNQGTLVPSGGQFVLVGEAVSGDIGPAANNGVPQNNSPNGTLSKIVDTFSRVTHPLDLMAVNASFFLGGGGAVIAGGAAIGLGCAEPTPAEPLTCAAGIAGGAPTIVGGTLLLQEGVNFFKTYTLPAIENWGSD